MISIRIVSSSLKIAVPYTLNEQAYSTATLAQAKYPG
jgi:hypothetical protein